MSASFVERGIAYALQEKEPTTILGISRLRRAISTSASAAKLLGSIRVSFDHLIESRIIDFATNLFAALYFSLDFFRRPFRIL